MDDMEDIEEALLSRIRNIVPENAQEVVSTIITTYTRERIDQYLSGLDDMTSLINNTKQAIKLKSDAPEDLPRINKHQQIVDREDIDGVKQSMKLKSKVPDCVEKLAHAPKEKQMQSWSKPMVGSSNATRYPQSRREPWNMPCYYIRDGFSTGNVSCPRLFWFRPWEFRDGHQGTSDRSKTFSISSGSSTR